MGAGNVQEKKNSSAIVTSHEIRRMKVADLKPAKYNPRKMNDVELKELETNLDKFGLVDTLVYNKQTNNLVGGHQRLKILKARGVEEVDVVVVDLGEDEEKALNIALNKIQGSWDEKLLKQLIAGLHDNKFNFDYTGFSKDELLKLMGPEWNPGFELGEQAGIDSMTKLHSASHVRMVQLFYNNESIVEFNRLATDLGKRFGKTNLTEIVTEALRRAHAATQS